MSNYVQSTNFATKDALPSGDPLKIVKGTEINTEFNNIAVAVATKANSLSPTFTGVVTSPSFVGPLTGNVTGNVAGNVTGNVTGNVAGDLTGNVTGNTSGTSANVTGIVAIANGGTGQDNASAAFDALKQSATETATGVVELATSAEASLGTDTSRVLTPAGLRDGLNATGAASVYAARAWVNFNGTGTVAIRASGNVSSITDNGTGDYTANFTTAMTDTNYSISGFCRQPSDSTAFTAASITMVFGGSGETTTTSCRFRVGSKGNINPGDSNLICVQIFR